MMEIYHIFASVFLIAQKWQYLADNTIYPKIGITLKQWLLIAVIQRKFPNYPPTISEAAREYGSSHQNIKKMALVMQKQKQMIITTDPEDRRIQRLVLTGKHREFFEGEENQRWQAEFVSKFFTGMKEEEIQAMNRYVGMLMERIKVIENPS